MHLRVVAHYLEGFGVSVLKAPVCKTVLMTVSCPLGTVVVKKTVVGGTSRGVVKPNHMHDE